jgi:hypothetical protein
MPIEFAAARLVSGDRGQLGGRQFFVEISMSSGAVIGARASSSPSATSHLNVAAQIESHHPWRRPEGWRQPKGQANMICRTPRSKLPQASCFSSRLGWVRPPFSHRERRWRQRKGCQMCFIVFGCLAAQSFAACRHAAVLIFASVRHFCCGSQGGSVVASRFACDLLSHCGMIRILRRVY